MKTLVSAPYGALGSRAVWTVVRIEHLATVVTDGNDEISPWDRDHDGHVLTVLVKRVEAAPRA